MIEKLSRFVGNSPTRTIEYMLAVFTILTGIFILTPYYSDISAPGISNAINSYPVITGFAIFSIFVAGVGIHALGMSDYNKKFIRRREQVSFFYFVIFLFFSISRLLFYSFASLIWTPTLFMALVAGVIYLRLVWEKND